MTTFYNFTLKTEASWAKTIAKPILETWNANDIFLDKKSDKMLLVTSWTEVMTS